MITRLEELKIYYQEILDGFSPIPESPFLLKHLSERDHAILAAKRVQFFKGYQKSGLQSKQEKLDILIKAKLWSADKEEQILTYKYNISDNERNIKSLIPEQHPPIRRMIELIRGQLKELEAEKHALLDKTADSFADRDVFNYMIFLSLYNDKGKPLFESYEDFEELPEEELLQYGEKFEQALAKFTSIILSQIGVCPFFLNALSLVKDTPFYFFHKPIYELTNYQSTLLSMGLKNLNVLSQAEGEPPDILEDTDLNDIVKWYDLNYSIMLGKSKSAR